MLRRSFLRIGVGAGSFLAAISIGLMSKGSATVPPTLKTRSVKKVLAVALRAIGTEPCLEAASRLESALETRSAFELHVRSAGIDASGAQMIAKALRSISEGDAVFLKSLSLSYNNKIGDEGAAALSHALPGSLREVGLVGCAIGDKGGQALLQWASQASGLKMLCIENNNFSDRLRVQFDLLGRRNEGLFVSV